MSFTSDLKKELSGIEVTRKCCQLSLLTGFIRFSGSIAIFNGKMGLKVSTDNPSVARSFIKLMKDYFGAKTSLKIAEGQFLRTGHTYILTITPEMNAEAILREVGILGIMEGSNYIKDGLELNNFKKRCCKKAALRGIFIAAGSITDPAKAYHLEISCGSEYIAKDVKKLINSFGLKSKIIKRRSKYIVYIKDAEQISEFLTIIGSSSILFKFEDIRMSKEMKNMANRASNCDAANAQKTVNAAQKIISDILYIKETKGLDFLPSKLSETARLRMDNPDLPLSELCLLFEPPIGKSGLNHRLAKISELANMLKNEKSDKKE